MKRRATVPARPAARQLATRPPLRRLFWALGRLRSGRPLKATDLAAEFEVNVRTAYRDLDFLRDEWRVPLEFDRAKASYCLTEPLAALPPVTLSQGELVALYFPEDGGQVELRLPPGVAFQSADPGRNPRHPRHPTMPQRRANRDEALL